MSKRELARVEVLARVRSKQLRVVDAGRLMQVSYRQAKRLWKRYREEGAAGLQHRSAGQPSNHGHEKKFRQKALQLVHPADLKTVIESVEKAIATASPYYCIFRAIPPGREMRWVVQELS